MRVVNRSANPATDRSHHGHREIPIAIRSPALHAGQFQKIDRVVNVIAELNFSDVAAACESQAHRCADDSALVERRVPSLRKSLSCRENAAERWSHVFTENISDTEVLFAIVKGH